MSLLNTDMKREKEHLATMLTLARDYARKNGFQGTFLVEPKPMEPTKHQYDYDTETVIGFLRHYGLDKDFKVNIEVNHATLAGHTFEHELQCAADAGMLGSIDANRGDAQNGWDTDQFPINLQETVEAMLVILRNGGFGSGGVNFDAKTRRNSTDAGRPFHRPHRRDGHLRPGFVDRRYDPARFAARTVAQAALRFVRQRQRRRIRTGKADPRGVARSGRCGRRTRDRQRETGKNTSNCFRCISNAVRRERSEFSVALPPFV